MDEKIRKILERAFSADIQKQRRGPNEKVFTYVEVAHYIARLNDAFAGMWSWEITRREQVNDQVVVEGRLTAGGVIKTGIGGSVITCRRGDDKPVSIADDYKKAEADCLKRCCRLLGIGAHLYTDDADDGESAQQPQQHPTTSPVSTPQIVSAATTTPARAATNERNRITQKQLNALLAISRARGWKDHAFREHVKERYGATLDYLTRVQASEMIGVMNANGHNQAQGQ